MATISNENYERIHIVSVGDPTLEKTNFVIATEEAGSSSAPQETSIICGAFATIADFSFFNLYSALNNRQFFIYFNKNGVVKRPIVSDKDGFAVEILTGDTDAEIAVKLANKINSDKQLSRYFTATVTDATVTIINNTKGLSLDASDGTGFLLTGVGAVTLQAIVGYIMVSERRGADYIQKQEFIKFVVNINASNVFYNY